MNLLIIPMGFHFSSEDDAVTAAESGGRHGCRGLPETQGKRAAARRLSSFTGSHHPAGGAGMEET